MLSGAVQNGVCKCMGKLKRHCWCRFCSGLNWQLHVSRPVHVIMCHLCFSLPRTLARAAYSPTVCVCIKNACMSASPSSICAVHRLAVASRLRHASALHCVPRVVHALHVSTCIHLAAHANADHTSVCTGALCSPRTRPGGWWWAMLQQTSCWLSSASVSQAAPLPSCALSMGTDQQWVWPRRRSRRGASCCTWSRDAIWGWISKHGWSWHRVWS